MEGHLRKRGDKWYYSFELASVGGERKRVERVGGRTKKEAAAKMRQAMAEYDRVGQVVDQSQISISDYMDYWMKNYVEVNLRYNSIRQHKSLIENHIKADLGKYRLSKLKSSDVQIFLNNKMKAGYSKGTISTLRTILSSSLGMAVHPWQFIKHNPATNIHMPKLKRSSLDEKDLKMITRDEYDKILSIFPPGSKYNIFLQLGFHTGMRPGEIRALQWKDVDLDGQKISISKTFIERTGKPWVLGAPKTESSLREISISKYLMLALKNHRKWQMENQAFYGPNYESPEGYNFICTHENGRPLKRASIDSMSKTIDRKLGINFNAHSLRHTHASTLYEKGMEPKLIQERLGHSKLSTTMDTYAHITDNLRKKELLYLEELSTK